MTKPPLATKWMEILAEVEELPADAAEWVDFAAFESRLREVATKKELVRSADAAAREREQRLAGIQREHGATLDYLGLTLNAERFGMTLRERERDRAIEDLDAILIETAALLARPPGNFGEQEEWTEKIRILRGRLQMILLVDGSPRGEKGPPTHSSLEPKREDGGLARRDANPPASSSIEPAAERLAVETNPPSVKSRERPLGPVVDADSSGVVNEIAARRLEDETPLATAPAAADPPPARVSVEPRQMPDAELLQALHHALAVPENPASTMLVHEVQLRWLSTGLNVHSYVLARVLEESPSEATAGLIHPAWVCWFAALADSAGHAPVEVHSEQFAQEMAVLQNADRARQQFVLLWLVVGLLGPGRHECQHFAGLVTEGILASEWLHASPFLDFCRRRIIIPAKKGYVVDLGETVPPREHLGSQWEKALSKAAQILERRPNFQNKMVTRYWGALVGPDGPVSELVSKAKNRSLTHVPSVQEVASQVPRWEEIVSRYRHNIEARLGEALGHLSEVARLDRLINVRNHTSTTRLDRDDVQAQSVRGRQLLDDLKSEGDPGQAPLRRVVESLERLTGSEHS